MSKNNKHSNAGALIQELEEEIERINSNKTVITGKMYRNLKRENGELKRQLEVMNKEKIRGSEKYFHELKWLIFDYMYGHDMNSVDEQDQIQFEDYFEEWWKNLYKRGEK